MTQQQKVLDTKEPFTFSMRGHEMPGIAATVHREFEELNHMPGIRPGEYYGTLILKDEIPRFLYVDGQTGMPQKRDVTLRFADKDVYIGDMMITDSGSIAKDHDGWEFGFGALSYDKDV
jgi:hypothetical protein